MSSRLCEDAKKPLINSGAFLCPASPPWRIFSSASTDDGESFGRQNAEDQILFLIFHSYLLLKTGELFPMTPSL